MDRFATCLVLLSQLAAAGVLAAESDTLYQQRSSWAQCLTATRRQLAEAEIPPHGPQWAEVCADLYRRCWAEFPEMDWFLQDSPQQTDVDQDFRPELVFGWYFQPDRDTGPEQSMIRRVLDELQAGAAPLRDRFHALRERQATVDDPAWLQLYADACQQRRHQRLAPVAQRVPCFVFTRHYTLGGSHYAYTEGLSDAQAERHFVPGAALCLAEWDGAAYRVEPLIEDESGVIRDPDVAYDGRRVLFSWKKSDRQDDYHLYELDLATRAVRQLTFGVGVADYEGCYLPDGDILFNSTRCVQTVDCWWTEVSNLYRCDGDGRYLRRITFDQVHDNYPTVTEDGRILYTRWEYNDRGQVYPQPLLQMNPDGTNQAEFYGVSSWFPTTILHARQVPGTQKVVAIATGHHTRQTGKLVLIDPARGRQENQGVQLLAPQRPAPAVRIDRFGQQGDLFQYPVALSETEYLVTYHPAGWWADSRPMGPLFGIYFLTANGRRERLVADPRQPCSQAVPVRPRVATRMRPSTVDYARTQGTCYVQDIHAGPGLAGVLRGTVRTLRVVALDFRAAGIGENRSAGPGGGALASTPVAIGNGTWDPKLILGDTPVHADGSVFFAVPARTPVYFQLLDERGQMVQTMRSWTSLQPGENVACVGCHEHENSVPLAAASLTTALRGGAQPLRPLHDIDPASGFSFAEHIQPILERHCTRCHTGRDGEASGLTSREVTDPQAKRRWTEGYLALTHARPDKPETGAAWRGDPDHPMVNWTSAQSAPTPQPPYAAGSACSELMHLLDQGHEDVVLAPDERDKLAAWIDLGVPFCGDYLEANAWTDAELAKYRHYLDKRLRLQAQDARNVRELAGGIAP
jgi:hypothetical protein